MRKTIIMLALAGLLGILTACNGEVGPLTIVRGSGNVITETREVSDFDAVDLSGAGRLIIEQTGTESLSITADENFMNYIETTVRNGKLTISIQDGITFGDIPELTYNVTVIAINDLELSGAGEVLVSGLDGEAWQVSLSGGGNIEVAGQVDSQTVDIDGAGAYQAAELATRETTIRHDGAGIAVVRVSEMLDVTINGLGSVEYIGDPTVTQEINGVGSVRQQ